MSIEQVRKVLCNHYGSLHGANDAAAEIHALYASERGGERAEVEADVAELAKVIERHSRTGTHFAFAAAILRAIDARVGAKGEPWFATEKHDARLRGWNLVCEAFDAVWPGWVLEFKDSNIHDRPAAAIRALAEAKAAAERKVQELDAALSKSSERGLECAEKLRVAEISNVRLAASVAKQDAITEAQAIAALEACEWKRGSALFVANTNFGEAKSEHLTLISPAQVAP